MNSKSTPTPTPGFWRRFFNRVCGRPVLLSAPILRADVCPLPSGAEKFSVTPEIQAQIDRALLAWESIEEAKAMIYLSAEASENEWPPLTHVPTGQLLIQSTVPALIECEASLRREISGAYLDSTPIPDAVAEAASLVRTTAQLLTIAGREMAAGRIGGTGAE